eukprot:3292247-Rhodomonas_salina.2
MYDRPRERKSQLVTDARRADTHPAAVGVQTVRWKGVLCRVEERAGADVVAAAGGRVLRAHEQVRTPPPPAAMIIRA